MFSCTHGFYTQLEISITYSFINRYLVSQGEQSTVKVNETVSVSTTNLHQLSGEEIYESVDPDEMQSTKPVTVNATANTAVSMQENPAYAYGMINEAKPKPQDMTDYEDIVMQ